MNYIVTNSVSKSNKYYLQCKKENKPYILASKRSTYYFITLDMYPCAYDLTKNGLELIKKLFREEEDYLESIRARSREILSGYGLASCSFNSVRKERLDRFCNRLYEIGTKYIIPYKFLKNKN